MRSLSLLSLLLLSACGKIIGGGNGGSECVEDRDCFDLEYCFEGRCRPGSNSDWNFVQDQAEILDLVIQDASLDDSPPPSEDWRLPTPEVGLRPFGEAGELCFNDHTTALLESEQGTHIPQIFCTPQVLAWTQASSEERAPRLLFLKSPEQELPELALEQVLGALVLEGEYLLHLAPDPQDGVPRVQRLKLLSGGSAATLGALGGAQRQPRRFSSLSAYIQQWGMNEERPQEEVIIHSDEDEFRARSCRNERGEWRQWGVVIGPDGLAWFERALGQEQIKIVLSRDWACGARQEFPLEQEIRRESRLEAGRGFLAWIGVGSEGPQLSYLDLAQGQIHHVEAERPVELSARADRLALLRFGRSGYLLDLYQMPDLQPSGFRVSGDLRRPSLSERYLLWVQQQQLQRWDIHYEILQDD